MKAAQTARRTTVWAGMLQQRVTAIQHPLSSDAVRQKAVRQLDDLMGVTPDDLMGLNSRSKEWWAREIIEDSRPASALRELAYAEMKVQFYSVNSD